MSRPTLFLKIQLDEQMVILIAKRRLLKFCNEMLELMNFVTSIVDILTLKLRKVESAPLFRFPAAPQKFTK